MIGQSKGNEQKFRPRCQLLCDYAMISVELCCFASHYRFEAISVHTESMDVLIMAEMLQSLIG